MFDKKTIEKIRNSSAVNEKAAKLPPFVMNLIYNEKLFKLFAPKEVGGRMIPLPEALRLFDEAGYIDGNLGWAVTIGSGGGYFYGYMQTKTAHQVFSDPKAVIAGSGHPSAIAEKVKGGYNVTGQWKYASGAPYATAFTANAMIKGTQLMQAFTFLHKQVSIIKDWNALGMKATESYSFKVSKAFVSYEMTFDLANHNLFYDSPIYRYPFLQFAETSFAALVIGLGRHFLEEANNIISSNQKVWGGNRYKSVKKKHNSAEKVMEKAISGFYDVVDKSWDCMLKDNKLQPKLQQQVSKISKQTSKLILTQADDVIQYLGMQAMMEDSNINRIWRDLHTACQHILLVPFE